MTPRSADLALDYNEGAPLVTPPRARRASAQAPKPLPPTVSIYQNPDYVEGILQQVYGQPLLTEFANESRDEQGDSRETAKGAKGKVDLTAKFPGLFGGGATVEADYENRLAGQQTTSSTASSRAHYTQPYYLHVVRSALRQTGLIHEVSDRAAVESLKPGEFVEFSASFESSQVSALLDIVTPDLVEQIVRRELFRKGMASFEGGALEKVQEFKLRLDGDMDTWGAVGRAATEAVRADFRSAKTREFYGRVGSGDEQLTFVTMCDAEHFVVEDEDRILDGWFTVLGKIAGPMTEDEPILARNKVLERMHPEAVDQVVASMNESVRKQGEKVNTYTQTNDADEGQPDDDADTVAGASTESPEATTIDQMAPADIFNFTLDARVAGASVRIIPVAIFL